MGLSRPRFHESQQSRSDVELVRDLDVPYSEQVECAAAVITIGVVGVRTPTSSG